MGLSYVFFCFQNDFKNAPISPNVTVYLLMVKNLLTLVALLTSGKLFHVNNFQGIVLTNARQKGRLSNYVLPWRK